MKRGEPSWADMVEEAGNTHEDTMSVVTDAMSTTEGHSKKDAAEEHNAEMPHPDDTKKKRKSPVQAGDPAKKRGRRRRGGAAKMGQRPPPAPRLLPPPEGWSDTPAFGALIGNFLLPMKTPLSRNEFFGVGLHHPDEIVRTVDYLYPNRRIAGVLDLTSRRGGYYPRREFEEAHGITVAAVPFPPHQEPPADLLEEALGDVQRMWRQTGPDSIVLVHCTHGLNRTGAFVCAALQRFMAMDPWGAMLTFQNARPPGMQHPNMTLNVAPHACWEGAQGMSKK